MMNKQAIPHILLRDGKSVDLYFEHLEPDERSKVFKDLMKGIEIKLPNFGQTKNRVKQINKQDIDEANEGLIKRLLKTRTRETDLDYDEKKHRYKLKAKLDFIDKIYRLKDIPKKRQHLFDRVKKIYKKVNDKKINEILDGIKIVFRKQDEKGASNHLTKTIYISLNEITKYNLQTEQQFLDYLIDPKSIITHETTHIVQNLLKAFPDTNYLKKEQDGDLGINYKKYISDPGEVQSRIEQILELLQWGFEKDEIVQFLYNRKQKDQDLWHKMIDEAKELRKKAVSKLPGDDENGDGDEVGIVRERGRKKKNYPQKDLGKNWESDFMT